MDKPISLSDKDFLIRKLSVKLMMSEQTINTIITHQIDSLYNAMKTNDIVELAGWGKFHFNTKKAQKRIIELQAIIESLTKQLEKPNANIELINYKIASTTDVLNSLKARVC
jgi:subtilase family serine protease